MSDKKKKVIHVRDLIVKADHVHIEQRRPKRRRNPWDPLVRGRPHHEGTGSKDESDDGHRESEEDEGEGGPSWI
ncbi:MAG TPA: hypothetical protein VK119_02360 [Bacillota bacterium]|nr:hypothetical protein [Bacillota bacterium]